MSLFECSKCGVIENTAVTSGSWSNLYGNPKKPMECSECADGQWHGLFPRQSFEGSGYVKNGWRVERPSPAAEHKTCDPSVCRDTQEEWSRHASDRVRCDGCGAIIFRPGDAT